MSAEIKSIVPQAKKMAPTPAKFFTPGLQNPIRQIASTSNPDRVLFLKVAYTTDSNGNPQMSHYNPKSGTYDLGGGTITDFVTSARSGGSLGTMLEPLPSYDTPPTASPEIKYPCYVVFAINKNNLGHFRKELDAITTDDMTANEYFNLTYVLDDGTTFSGNNLQPNSPPSSTSPCHIVYFQAISPSTEGEDALDDGFNLYVNVLQANSTYKAGTIDPAIKNIGH